MDLPIYQDLLDWKWKQTNKKAKNNQSTEQNPQTTQTINSKQDMKINISTEKIKLIFLWWNRSKCERPEIYIFGKNIYPLASLKAGIYLSWQRKVHIIKSSMILRCNHLKGTHGLIQLSAAFREAQKGMKKDFLPVPFCSWSLVHHFDVCWHPTT